MKDSKKLKPISNNDIHNLEQFIELIDPENKVFGVTKTIIEEKKKIKVIETNDIHK